MSNSKHGRPVASCLRNFAFEQVRTGNVLSRRSSVCRIAYACAYGPKYSVPARRRPRITVARGHSSERVMARNGYDLSSRRRMLKRGLCFWMRVYSSMRASTSFSVTIQSTESAAATIARVRTGRSREKYEPTLLRSDFALPT